MEKEGRNLPLDAGQVFLADKEGSCAGKFGSFEGVEGSCSVKRGVRNSL